MKDTDLLAEKYLCSVKIIKHEKNKDAWVAFVRVPLSSDSFMPIYLEAPSQSCMMELIRSIMFKKFQPGGF